MLKHNEIMIENLVNRGVCFAPADKAGGGSGETGKGLYQYLEFEGSTPTRAVIRRGEDTLRVIPLQVARSLDSAVPPTFGARVRKALHNLLRI